MKRVVAATVVAASALLVSGVVVAMPASASTTCPDGYSCIWRDTGYLTNGNGASYVKDFYNIPHYVNWSYAGTSFNANDSATSVYNNGIGTAYFYVNGGCSGGFASLAGGTGDADLNNNVGAIPTSVYQDAFSSTAFAGYVSTCN